MFRQSIRATVYVATLYSSTLGFAADDAEITKIREEMRTLKEEYEASIKQLEQRLDKAEQRPATAPIQSSAATTNAFNPAISLILGGQYSNLQRDPATYRIGGFIPGGTEVGPGSRSFNLGESELTISANIDPYFSGYFVMAVSPENEVGVEEGYVRNTGALPGVSLKFGRFLSGFGYLNEIHAHAWDFTDAPLVHQAFFGGALEEDGLQVRWLAPTPVFLEAGAETGRGANFPGSDRGKNGVNGGLFFVHLGDDVGVSHSYRAGASYRVTKARDRFYGDLDASGASVIDAFTGDSKMWGVDLVWKWAPNGNSVERNFKFQAEYMHRTEDGSLSFDTTATNLSGAYRSSQSGWYAQGAYQFMPRWRVGLRYEQLDSGGVAIGLVDNGTLTATDFPRLLAHDPKKTTAMIDFSPSEFSRLRLQFSRDEARLNESDHQLFVQYIMSLGVHGAHKF